MFYLIDPKSITDARCLFFCKKLVACPIDFQHPLYGIDT